MKTILYCLLCVPALGATYHVAQTEGASDQHPGTAELPWRTLTRACEAVAPGDTVVVHGGVYREALRPGRSGTAEQPITFEAATGERVVITGADLITGWAPVAGRDEVWSVPWPHKFIINTVNGRHIYHHPSDEQHRVIGRPEQVFADGVELAQVLTPEELTRGTFCADPEAEVLYVCLTDGGAPDAHHVEASTRSLVCGDPWGVRTPLDYVIYRGFVFRYGASFAQRGGVGLRGTGCVIERCVIEKFAGAGLSVTGRNNVARDVVCRANGQIGGGAGGENIVFERVDFVGNNTQGFNAGWEAGGIKIANARGVHLIGCRAIGNRGPGLWYDIDNRDSRVERCQAWHNVGPGVFIEISGPGIAITDGLFVGNGTDGQWGGAGILVAESRGVVVERNVCVGNVAGLGIRQQGIRSFRNSAGEDLSFHIEDVTFRDNACADNRQAQFYLWWDNPAMGPHPSPNVGMRGDVVDPDAVRIVLEHNDFWSPAENRRPAVVWGAGWRPKHVVYETAEAFDAARESGRGNVAVEPRFVAPEWGDYRQTEDSPARAAGFVWRTAPARLDANADLVVGGEAFRGRLVTGDAVNRPEAWAVEHEPEVTWSCGDGRLRLVARDGKGATAWYRPELPADLLVRYRARALPPHDAANLNAFLAAREADGSDLAFGRDGRYASYHEIPNYIFTFTAPQEGRPEAGWSRLRRDPGFALLSERRDRASASGVTYAIAIAKQGGRVRVWVDGELFHDVLDDTPHGGGWFGFRTWSTEAEFEGFEAYELAE